MYQIPCCLLSILNALIKIHDLENSVSLIKLHKKLTTKIVTLLLCLLQRHIENYL